MSSSPPGPRQYRALAQLAAKRRRIGRRADKANDQVTAIGEYRAVLDLVRQIAAIEPADHDVLRQLAADYHHEGHFAAVMGYAVVVRHEYRAELILLERLSRDRPEDAGLLRARADAHHELARRAQFDGDQEGARREQQAEMAIVRQLALADPETGDVLREAMAGSGAGPAEAVPEPGQQPAEAAPAPAPAGTAGTGGAGLPGARLPGADVPGVDVPGAEEQIETLKALVDRARSADDGATARAGLQALILVRKRIVAARPGDAGALEDLAMAHRELGWRWQTDGDDEAAKREILAEVAVLRQMALADPQTGDVLREALAGAGAAGPAGAPGEAERPVPAPGAGLASEEPAGAEPADAEPADAEEQAQSLTALAARARDAGDLATLRDSLQALVLLRERMAAARPGEAGAQRELAGAHRRLSDCYADLGQGEAACESSMAEVGVLVLLAAADPSDVDRLNALASAYGVLADRARNAGPLDRARAAARAEVIIRSWLALFQPVSWRQDALEQAQRRLASLPLADPPSGGLLSG